jgi:hypothetical protein
MRQFVRCHSPFALAGLMLVAVFPFLFCGCSQSDNEGNSQVRGSEQKESLEGDASASRLMIARLIASNEMIRLHSCEWETRPELREVVEQMLGSLTDQKEIGLRWEAIVISDVDNPPAECEKPEREMLRRLQDGDQDALERTGDGLYRYARVYHLTGERAECSNCHQLLTDNAGSLPASAGDRVPDSRESAMVLRISFPEGD